VPDAVIRGHSGRAEAEGRALCIVDGARTGDVVDDAGAAGGAAWVFGRAPVVQRGEEGAELLDTHPGEPGASPPADVSVWVRGGGGEQAGETVSLSRRGGEVWAEWDSLRVGAAAIHALVAPLFGLSAANSTLLACVPGAGAGAGGRAWEVSASGDRQLFALGEALARADGWLEVRVAPAGGGGAGESGIAEAMRAAEVPAAFGRRKRLEPQGAGAGAVDGSRRGAGGRERRGEAGGGKRARVGGAGAGRLGEEDSSDEAAVGAWPAGRSSADGRGRVSAARAAVELIESAGGDAGVGAEAALAAALAEGEVALLADEAWARLLAARAQVLEGRGEARAAADLYYQARPRSPASDFTNSGGARVLRHGGR